MLKLGADCQRGSFGKKLFTVRAYVTRMFTSKLWRSQRNRHKNTAAAAPPWLGIAGMLTDAAFETDARGRFTAFSPGTVLGFDPQTLLGTYAAGIFAGAERALAVIIDDVCTKNLSWHGQTNLRHAHGHFVRYRLAMAPLHSAGGDTLGVAGLLTNLDAPELADHASNEPGTLPPRAAVCPETGLWSAACFAEQAARRFDRLDVEDLPGTLILLGFSAPPHLQTAVAVQIAAELRDIMRPADLLGRQGQSAIAIWCDNMDHLTASERAARLCTRLPMALPQGTQLSAGLVTRWPGSADTPLQVIERAERALQQAYLAAKDTKLGTWRVWQNDSAA